MTIDGPKFEPQEREPMLDVNILSLYYCQTIDEMIERIEAAKVEGKINLVLLGEYDFKVEKVLTELHKRGQEPFFSRTKDTDRDYFLSAQEAQEYGLVDKIIQ